MTAPPRPAWLARTWWQRNRPLVPTPLRLFRAAGLAARTLGGAFTPARTRRRLERLYDKELIDVVPDHWQLLVAGHHMMLGTASDETRIWYAQRGIRFGWHNLRRFLDAPASMMDPVGFLAPQPVILHHVLQSAHVHPVYDFHLLEGTPGGMAALETQVQLAVDGRHPDQARLDVLVEDPDYHRRLLAQVRAYRDAPIRRAPSGTYDHVDDPLLRLAMDQFKDPAGLCAYAAALPVGRMDAVATWLGALWAATLGRWGRRSPVTPDLTLFSPALRARYGVGDGAGSDAGDAAGPGVG